MLYCVVEIALQLCLERFDSAAMVIVILCFCPVMAVLMGVLYRFYGTQGFGPEDRSVKPGEVARADGPTAPCDGEGADGPLERRLCFARAHGLSDRETEVFLLLAQGDVYKRQVDEGVIKKCDTIEELEEALGLRPGVLVAEVEKWNAACEVGEDYVGSYKYCLLYTSRCV